ncbi:hypothetical protein BKN37_03855 [Mycobacterium talmoniae]|nr:hypothetical protein BKN37_03855 [Mycobacterium talmoniae]
MYPGVTELKARIAASITEHGFIAGFSTARSVLGSDGVAKTLTNMVLRFPDADAAAAAAHEMAAIGASAAGAPERPVAIDHHPEAIASIHYDDGDAKVESFAPHGPYMLYQYAFTAKADDQDPSGRALQLIAKTLDLQVPLIDRFVPTDPSKLAALPKDPTGLMSRVLSGDGDQEPGRAMGVWGPDTWLHFAFDPIETAHLLDMAGVDRVAQRLTTIYQARDTAGATLVADQISAGMTKFPSVKPIPGVPGFPIARCFNRTKGFATNEGGPSVQRLYPRYTCVARVDRYAFTSFSNHEVDAKQQLSAQYLILAGK